MVNHYWASVTWLTITESPCHGYVEFVIITIRFFLHSWLIIGFVARILRLAPLVEQELPTLPKHPSSLLVLRGIPVARLLVFYGVFWGSLFVRFFFFAWPFWLPLLSSANFFLAYIDPLMLWVRILIWASCTILCDKVCQWLATGMWFSTGTPVSSTNKTDSRDIAEILLEVSLNIIKQTNQQIMQSYNIHLKDMSELLLTRRY